MFSYRFLNHPGFSFSEEKTSLIFQYVAESVEREQHGIIDIVFLPDEEMRRLNATYRNIDKTTDVLSFHYFDDFSSVTDDMVAGEIVLSESKILSQSIQFDHPPQSETEILILHGVLHILGYDHEDDDDFEKMWTKEAPIREKLGLNLER